MKRTLSTFILAGAFALGGLPALAAEPHAQQQSTMQGQKERLENGYRALARRTPVATKRSAMEQAELAKQERAIKDLIHRVEAGENVAPSEVDRVLQGQ